MNKGKAKKTEKKYLSIVLVPHSSSHVKILRFTSFYVKLITCFTLLIVVFITGSIYISKMLDENMALRQNITELYSANTEQRKLLDEKYDEVNQLKEESAAFSENVNNKIEDITDYFNKITDTYISERISSKTDRSGDRTEASFSNDIQILKESIDTLSQLYSRTDRPKADLTAAEAKLAKYMDTVPTLWPIPSSTRITDSFGYRKDPFTRKTQFHQGIDIGADYGASIKAAASGKIIMSESTGGYGRTVKIDHGRGIVTLYGHASKLLVKVGQTVKKGDVIAKVGSSGRSTGPHLHFEVLLYGTPVDPIQYLDVE